MASIKELLLEDFVVRALLAGLGAALAAGPLGCFVLWRRMAFFGDALAHSALFGIALGLLLGTHMIATVSVVGLGLAVFLSILSNQRWLASDALLGIYAHTALSAGIIALSVLTTVRVDLDGYLFGDILAAQWNDVAAIWGGAAAAVAVLSLLWRSLLAATVDRDLARAEGHAVHRSEAAFMLVMAITVASLIKVVGVLLTTALLILPAASARGVARTPEGMAAASAVLGSVAVVSGLAASFVWDVPTGPAVVVVAACLFFVILLLRFAAPRR